ncbi:hypothetical protein [Mesorhizobium onobrychidis]|uniref:Uncharacterized protein n=1 Tax=Mesorhizobium onobrychidis TaxID=2775404 RepID=A0ABY5R7V3_9HYPH|nr:hypothetical protein [Mesorhizobium onobrychidis]UVC19279.1 hypothetical protein IHQ72_33960 [Mesorhizobium onobrychidis]
MTAPAGCQLIGRWRIIEADLWDRGYLNLGGPADCFKRDGFELIDFLSDAGVLAVDLSLNFHPAAIRASTATQAIGLAA